ncbi:unnamed protein product [Rotaria sp. Silwood1]|nr:unnamed protein product [Rotaria sp. Silwood1]CAF1589018.1 unnamed protein product [Rotaria sp. Silwood1]
MNTLKKTVRSYFRTSTQHVHYQHLRLSNDQEDEEEKEEEETLRRHSTEEISLTFRDLTKVVTADHDYDDDDLNLPKETTTTKRVLLHNISGSVHPGEILAVMGASGSGKTTLLNTLNNRSTGGVSGEILFNNQPYNHSQMKQKIAYVVQDDEFFDTLTVREQMIFIARLKLSWHLHEKHVQLLVKKLNLQKSINSPIYLISNGEKKRLSIAIGLLTNPSILLLDGYFVFHLPQTQV